jgi:hypothetical protein
MKSYGSSLGLAPAVAAKKMMENVNRNIPENIKIIHVCDREGDIYDLKSQ